MKNPPMETEMTLVAAARLHGEHTADKEAIAIEFENDRVSYGELRVRIEMLRRYLVDKGLQKGERVVYMGGASVSSIVAMLAVQQANGIFVPVNPKYGREELTHILSDSGASEFWYDTQPGFWHELQTSFVDVHPRRVCDLTSLMSAAASVASTVHGDRQEWPNDEDVALLIYTSGTTGRSKGVALSYRAILENIHALTSSWEFHPHDRLILQLPLFHVHGLCIGLYGTLMHGMTALLSARFQPKRVVEAFSDDGATVFMGVPTMYARLLEYVAEQPTAAVALAKARLFTSGSAPLPDEHFQRFASLTGHHILERYGMSETLLTLSNPYRGERRSGTVGMPVDGCSCRLVNDEGAEVSTDELGELWVKSNGIMSSYWRQPIATAESFSDGWFRTGDVAKRSADGYFTLVGRQSTDIIKSGGFKISTREIEEVLLRHPDVQELAVVGIPDSLWGEVIAAVVVPKASATEKSPNRWVEELQQQCENVLADYKKPRVVFVRESLPRNALGKVQKKLMQTQLNNEKGPA